jgi:predicted GNAT family N-acyltransferase
MLNLTWQPFQNLSLHQFHDAMLLRQRIFVIAQTCLYMVAFGLSGTKITDSNVAQNGVFAG